MNPDKHHRLETAIQTILAQIFPGTLVWPVIERTLVVYVKLEGKLTTRKQRIHLLLAFLSHSAPAKVSSVDAIFLKVEV